MTATTNLIHSLAIITTILLCNTFNICSTSRVSLHLNKPQKTVQSGNKQMESPEISKTLMLPPLHQIGGSQMFPYQPGLPSPPLLKFPPFPFVPVAPGLDSSVSASSKP